MIQVRYFIAADIRTRSSETRRTFPDRDDSAAGSPSLPGEELLRVCLIASAILVVIE